MYFSYNKLWKLLIDKGMKKQELAEKSHVSTTSLAKLAKNENVTTDVLRRICEALDCDLVDIVETIHPPNTLLARKDENQ
ncbi:MAG: helix-turn-helix transcriptional regulator [Peptoniphilaceae bacterium]|nr:helix-turn-helix transcriptional regulator [Peptoniphilaceae bacterium]